jgi:hypothetical protein
LTPILTQYADTTTLHGSNLSSHNIATQLPSIMSSPPHKDPTNDCALCGQHFKDPEALKQHEKTSDKHAACVHAQQDSLAHRKKPFPCTFKGSKRKFYDEAALQQHMKEYKSHRDLQTTTNTSASHPDPSSNPEVEMADSPSASDPTSANEQSNSEKHRITPATPPVGNLPHRNQ